MTARARSWISPFRVRYLDFSRPQTRRCITPPGASRWCACTPSPSRDWTVSSKPIRVSLSCSAGKSPRTARAHDHLANVGLRDAKQRIAHLLLELYVRVRGRLPVEPGETIQLPLSQGQIGQAVGLTYVHVCRTLQILRERGIIQFANHNLEIIDPVALIATAGVEYDLPTPQRIAGQPRLARPTGRPTAPETAGSLPVGWMPIQNDCPAPRVFRNAYAPAKAA